MVRAGELVFIGNGLREGAHGAALVSVFQPVEEHVVIHRVVAGPGAAAMLFQQIGGIGHAFHAAGDDEVDAARREGLGTHDDGLHARAADLVDRAGLNVERQAGLQRRLPGGGLANACRQHAAHVDALDIGTINPRALDGGLHRGGAQIGGGGIGQRAGQAAHRRAGIGENHDRV